MIKLKRAYEKSAKDDGERILVERLWLRGLTKEQAKLDLWLKDIAPSTELRRWFGHDPDRWIEFRQSYLKELRQKTDLIKLLKRKAKGRSSSFIIHPVQFLTGDHLVHRREADLPRDALRRARISPQRALHESRMGGG